MKNFIFAYILFALLLTVNAAPFQLNKRAITFGPCNTTDLGDLLNVKLGIDPPESEQNELFDVSGNLTKYDITKNQTFLFISYRGKDGYLLSSPKIRYFNYSTKVGNPFNISVSVPTPELPDSYLLKVAVGDPAYDPTLAFPFFACVTNLAFF
ncbi:hypothetical protein C2G38_2270615 [Gigaspora rosea]|uniref:Uncharacterized protein n=1 Tax=Gigaspora rosea TaxID=44941 RepID=A0A397UMP4_9GLOM|nr:hypothetical protein C2G38_2270615 [Gigaspora rosea]